MSALGQKQTFALQNGMSALPLKADTRRRGSDERISAIVDSVICDTDVTGPETQPTGFGRRLLAGGFMLHQLFGFALFLAACLAVFLALRLGRPDGSDDQDRRGS
jgi:hypothetical protein